MDRLDVHFPAETAALLRRLADAEGISRNALVRRFVDEALARRCLAQSPASDETPPPSPSRAPGNSTHPWRRSAVTPRAVPGGRRTT